MNDNITDLRIKAVTGLIKCSDNPILLSNSRHESKLSLRKQKLDEMLLYKRKENLLKQNGSLFIPYINLSQIPQDILNAHFSSESDRMYSYISLLPKIFPKNINLAYYLLNQVYNIISPLISDSLSSFPHHQEVLVNDFIDKSIIEQLHNVLENNVTRNKIILFQVLKLYLQISMISNIKLMEKFITISFLSLYNEVFDLLTHNNKNTSCNSIDLDSDAITTNQEILCIFIQFLGNIIEGNEYIQKIYYTYNIDSKIFSLFRSLSETDLPLFKTILSFYVQFSYPQTLPSDSSLQTLYSIFSRTVFSFSTHTPLQSDILFDALTGLYFISNADSSSDLAHAIVNDGLLPYLISTYTDTNSTLLTLRMMLNITSVSDENCSILYTKEASDYLLRLIVGDEGTVQVKVEALWVMENVCIGTDMDALFKYENGFYENVVEYVMKEGIHGRVEREVMKFVVVCWNNTRDVGRFVNDKVVEMICNKMRRSEVNDDVLCVLIVMIEALHKWAMRSAVERIVNAGLREVLDKWLLHDCEEIRNETNELVKKIFS